MEELPNLSGDDYIVRSDLDRLRNDMQVEFQSVRKDMAYEFESIRKDMAHEFQSVRNDMQVEFQSVRKDMAHEFESVRNDFTHAAELIRKDLIIGLGGVDVKIAKANQKLVIQMAGLFALINGLLFAGVKWV